MRKDDVEFHSDGFRPGRPAVNVKVYGRVDSDKVFEDARLNGVDDPRFEPWYRERLEDDSFAEHYFEFACESGWEWLQTDAEDTFGKGVKVYSEGRSGGWAVVDGLPDFDSWDAVMLAKWARFAKSARITADAIPSDMAILAGINSFEVWKDEQAKRLTGPTFEAVA